MDSAVLVYFTEAFFACKTLATNEGCREMVDAPLRHLY